MRNRGVLDSTDDVVVKVFDGLMLRKAAARDHPELDVGAPELLHQLGAVHSPRRVQDHRKAEPGALPVLALNDKPPVVSEQLHEQRGIRTANDDNAFQLLECLKPDAFFIYKRPPIRTGHNETIGPKNGTDILRTRHRIMGT